MFGNILFAVVVVVCLNSLIFQVNKYLAVFGLISKDFSTRESCNIEFYYLSSLLVKCYAMKIILHINLHPLYTLIETTC